MSTLLSFDLVKMEQKLRNEVSEKFGERKWDDKCANTYDEVVKNGEMYYGVWAKMMATGKTPTARSTRRCLDNKRSFNRTVGNSGWTGVRL